MNNKELANLKRGQNIMTNMLREFDTICRNNNLKYWCVGGTLIGAVRDKGWIPHDADIDIGILNSDYQILKTIIQEKLSSKFWFQDKSTDKHYKSEIGKIRYIYGYYCDDKSKEWHNGLQLDLFVFNENNDKLEPWVSDYEIKTISKKMIFPLKELMFEDIKVYVPNEYVEYCKNVWGDCPPPVLPKHKQYPHEGRISFTIPRWMIKKYPELYK